jgi:hypothetical protein
MHEVELQRSCHSFKSHRVAAGQECHYLAQRQHGEIYFVFHHFLDSGCSSYLRKSHNGEDSGLCVRYSGHRNPRRQSNMVRADPASLAPVARSNTTNTARYNNGTMQQTATWAADYAPAAQTATTGRNDLSDSTGQMRPPTFRP